MARTLILGGGFGGVAAAVRLRELRPQDEIVLVDQGERFMMGFRKNAGIAGTGDLLEGSRPLAALDRHGIRVVRATVTSIDPEARAADAAGERIEADALLVALGVELHPEAVPGLAAHGINAYDAGQVPVAAAAVAARADGRAVIGIFGAPYRCPPAPYELALLLRDAHPDLDLAVFTPQPMSLPVLGKAGCEIVEGLLGLRRIAFRPNAAAERVEGGRVVLGGGDEVPFDLLLAVPPHRCPQVAVDAGLAEPGGWVKVDPATLETGVDGVWAVGDCVAIPLATGQPLPKAGVFAEREGIVAAERIADRLAGREATATFDGEGLCWLEVGGGEARAVRGRFLTPGGPEIELTPASPAMLEDKARYERERLEAWFG
ncbi:MAG TPA: FAD-dependent oxidoreductase [Actinomycetota bacterium]|nr:FAD-dependent oxidoreductase [Actinomycetota bacterium]